MNIKIKSIGYYHPETIYTNEYFLDKYKKQGIDIEGLLLASGRKNRYISEDANENSLTMAVKASKSALSKANMNADELDFIVFVSQTPEYLMPTTSLKLHKEIKAGINCGIYDMNVNCCGMVVAIDQITALMKARKNINKVLVVGAEAIYRHTKEDEPLPHALFGDSACAVILEKTLDGQSDIIDSVYYTDSYLHDNVHFPLKGLSHTLSTTENLKKEDRIINWGIGDADRAFAGCVISIDKLLKENGLTPNEIDKYCMTQMFKSKIDEAQEALGIDDNSKFPFIGDEFGYTATTSPLLALAKSIENGEVNRGDKIVLWGLGAGVTCISLLITY